MKKLIILSLLCLNSAYADNMLLKVENLSSQEVVNIEINSIEEANSLSEVIADENEAPLSFKVIKCTSSLPCISPMAISRGGEGGVD